MQISIFDELTEKTYFQGEDSPFEILTEELPYDGAVLRRLTIRLKPHEKPRSLRVYWHKKHLQGDDVRIWNTGFYLAERKLEKLLSPEGWAVFHKKHQHATWVWEGINFYSWSYLKQAAEFIPGQNCGWYLALPPEYPNGMMYYAITREEFILADAYRYIAEDIPVVSELFEITGCADWRPPLGWFREHFEDYFVPVNKDVLKLDGTFCLTNPLSSEATLDDAQKHGVCISELHNHYPCYGNFIPDMEKWQSVVLHDYPELPFPKDYISPQSINDFIDRLHAHGIKVLLYFQCTGDCYQPYAEAEFPEDIAVDKDGNKIPAWRECYLMNARPGTKYAKHIDTMLEEMFIRHPGIDGIFMDQVYYPYNDYAHTDDKTMGSQNKRISNIRESYYGVLEKTARMLHSRGKILWFNASFDLKAQRYADGIMAEGLYGGSEMMRYYCLDKPLLIHEYPETVEVAVTIFAYALRAGTPLVSVGGSPRKVDAILAEEPAAIYREGMRLIDPLQGRSWCFLPHPVDYPDGVTGNIFNGKEKDTFLITAVSPDSLPPERGVETIRIQFTLPGEWEGVCRSFGQEDVPVSVRDGFITVENHCGMSIIILKKK